MRFLINFLKALGVFTIWGLGTHLIFKFLKTYAIWLARYLDLMVLAFVVTSICALAASIACDMEDLK